MLEAATRYSKYGSRVVSVKTYMSLMAVSGNMQQLNDEVSTLLHNLTVGFTYLQS